MLWTIVIISAMNTVRVLVSPSEWIAQEPWYERLAVAVSVWPLALAALAWCAVLVGDISRRRGALLLAAATIPLVTLAMWARLNHSPADGLVRVAVLSAFYIGLYVAATFVVRPDSEWRARQDEIPVE